MVEDLLNIVKVQISFITLRSTSLIFFLQLQETLFFGCLTISSGAIIKKLQLNDN